MRNDLRAVIVFFIAMLIVMPVLELQTPATPPSKQQGNQTGNNQNQTPVMVTAEVLSRSAYTSEGQTTEETFGLGYTIVTDVKAELTWTDDYGSNDVFSIELFHEGQSLDKQQGSTGALTVHASAKSGENLAGNFSVNITCVSAPGIVGPSPVDRDHGNSWDLKVTATYSKEGAP
jgi:hypothetical protein